MAQARANPRSNIESLEQLTQAFKPPQQKCAPVDTATVTATRLGGLGVLDDDLIARRDGLWGLVITAALHGGGWWWMIEMGVVN
ncbi:hypothetical protein F5Y10DRAFT_264651 [Nemania abortiva]|nr:hypothetical protein F5Y10DRAFT_264651 [Nemania abortiva]